LSKKVSTKQLTLAAMLTALSLLITFSPIKLPLPQPFSLTFASHVPTLIAMFVSPWVAICTVIGSTAGFFINLGPVVALRAASHIFFVLLGVFMLKKRANAYLTLFLISIVHALAEALVIVLFSDALGFPVDVGNVNFTFIQLGNPMMNYLFNAVFCLVVFHHTVDVIISVAVLIPLEKAKFFKHTGLLRKKS